MSVFKKATRKQVRLRMALDGPAGSGKTFSGLRFAYALAGPTGRVAVINTESGAVEKYLGLAPDGIPFDFDIVTLDEFAPSTYMSTILEAGREGYDVVLVDSLSHAWEGKGGSLDQVDKASSKNSYTAWKDVTPQHRQMIEAILKSPCHVITTMRTKTEYVLEPNERGQMVPRRIGMKPVQREGMEYEFDIVVDLDHQHVMRVSKTRCPEVDGMVVMKPGASFMSPIVAWLKDGSTVSADHFAVKESELKAWQDSQKGPPPKVDTANYLERMKQKAAESAATSSPSQTEPKPTLCEENQRLQIEDLLKQLETSADDQAEILSRRNVSRIADLTAAQASELIDKLLPMHAAKVAAEKKVLDEVPF